VFRLRSVNSIVIAPARTGRESNSRRAVIAIDHTNSGIRSGFMLFGFILIVVVIKFTVPRIEDTPAKWRDRQKDPQTSRLYFIKLDYTVSYYSNILPLDFTRHLFISNGVLRLGSRVCFRNVVPH